MLHGGSNGKLSGSSTWNIHVQPSRRMAKMDTALWAVLLCHWTQQQRREDANKHTYIHDGKWGRPYLVFLPTIRRWPKEVWHCEVRVPLHEKKECNIWKGEIKSRRQQLSEPVDAFFTDLYRLAEHCQYSILQDELIRDRIAVELQSAALSEIDPELTLEKAVTTVRHTKNIKQQNVWGSSRESTR